MKANLQTRGPWILIEAVLGLFAIVATNHIQNEKRQLRAHFESDAGRIEEALQERLQNYGRLLLAVNDFIGSQRVDSALWRKCVSSLKLEKNYPTLTGLGYAAYVPEDQRNPQMKIIPKGKRFDYMVIQQVDPRKQNARLIGYDLGSDLVARVAAEHARDIKGAVLTGKLLFPDDPGHYAFLLLCPLFRHDDLQGWIFERFEMEDFFKGIPFAEIAPIALQAYDGPAMTREGLVFDSGAPLSAWQKPNEGAITLVKGFPALGRTWTLNLTPRSGTAPTPEPPKSAGVPLSIVVGLLIIVGSFAWAWTQRMAETLAHRTLAGMRLRETALTLGPHGLMIADATQADWPLQYVNRAFEKITGYSAQEVLGKNGRFLIGTDRDQKGLQDLRRALREQHECRVLVRNYRKDGTPFWNDLFVAPVRNDMGRVVEFVAVQQDVTEREQTIRRLATESSIIRALSESPSLYEAAPRILKAICEAQEWDMGTFWRLDPRTQTLQCIDLWRPIDYPMEDLEDFVRQTTFSRDLGVPGHVWAKAESVWLPDLSKETRFPDASLASQAGMTSACGFPIANRRGLQGVLVFYSRRIWPLSKNLLLLMVGTGAQISQYMEREKVEIEQKEITLLERGLAEFMGEGLLAMDRDGYCIYANSTAGKMLGHQPRTLLGQNVHEFLHPAIGAARCTPGQCPLLLSLHSTRAVHVDDHEAVFIGKDRTPLPVAYTTSPIISHDLIQGVVVTFVDASTRRAQDAQLRKALEEKESSLLIEKIRKLLG